MLQRVMSRLSVDIFLTHSTEIFVEEPFCAVLQKISGGEKVYGKEGGSGEYRNFPSKVFISKCPIIS